MKASILIFDGFNEIDCFVAYNILNRLEGKMNALIVSPSKNVVSMNGLTIEAQGDLDHLNNSDAVLIASGVNTINLVKSEELLQKICLNQENQLLASQCSGVLFFDALGLITHNTLTTDESTAKKLLDRDYNILSQPFYAEGNIGYAGGCLSAHYLATWIIIRLHGESAAREALAKVSPCGEIEFIEKAIKTVKQYVA